MPSQSGNPPEQAAEVLDLRGEVCPFTFVRTKLKLEQMAPGSSLRLLVDYEPATRNVPRSVKDWGQTVTAVTPTGDGTWSILITKCTDESGSR